MINKRNKEFSNGVSAYQEKHFDMAITYFKMALRAPFDGGPNTDNLILNNIGTCYSVNNMHNEAIHYYKQAIENGLDNDDVLFSIATSYFKIGDFKTAIIFYNKVLDKNLNNGKGYYLRGKCYQKMGEFFKGNEDLGKAIALNYLGK